jgi:hypothetical protein
MYIWEILIMHLYFAHFLIYLHIFMEVQFVQTSNIGLYLERIGLHFQHYSLQFKRMLNLCSYFSLFDIFSIFFLT